MSTRARKMIVIQYDPNSNGFLSNSTLAELNTRKEQGEFIEDGNNVLYEFRLDLDNGDESQVSVAGVIAHCHYDHEAGHFDNENLLTIVQVELRDVAMDMDEVFDVNRQLIAHWQRERSLSYGELKDLIRNLDEVTVIFVPESKDVSNT